MMSAREHIFTFINDEKLCTIIESAMHHIIYAAPSIAASVTQALCEFAGRNEHAALRVIVDADAEAFRLGFGDHAGLKLLAENGIDIRSAKGLRIAALIVDKDAWVYAPTPQIIFEQPTIAINNAIQVSVAFAEQILLSIAPDVSLKSATTILKEDISTSDFPAFANPENLSQPVVLAVDTENDDEVLSASILAVDLTPEIGTEVLTIKDVVRIEQELKENPPQKFDAARKVRVYQGYFQFVELSLTGCQLNRHTINIPKSLLNIAEDSNLRDRVRSTCRLVDDTSKFSLTIKKIENQVAAMRKAYTKSLGKDYGVVILRRAREEFEQELLKIRADLEKLRDSVKADLETEIKNSRKNLIRMLLPGVLDNPPKALTAQLFGNLSKKTAIRFIRDELNKQLPLID